MVQGPIENFSVMESVTHLKLSIYEKTTTLIFLDLELVHHFINTNL
jgi:hypothetical protein